LFSDERFGFSGRYNAFGDGPKFVCGVDVIAAKGKDCLVYSVGSNNRIEFETAVHDAMGCDIHVFDPTVAKNDFIGGHISTFYQWRLGIDGRREGKSVETIMKELGHVNRKIDILKIDCEGCEYDVMPVLFDQMAEGKIAIDQILIEMHTVCGRRNAKDIKDLFAGVDKAKMRIFHKERNNWGCDGYKCVEYAFVSESFLSEANKAIVCPTSNLKLPFLDSGESTIEGTTNATSVLRRHKKRITSKVTGDIPKTLSRSETDVNT